MTTDTDEQAWREGLEAGRAGLAADVNPYETANPLAEEWHDGWREGTHARNLPMDPDAWALP
jgi:ribosome modulation factor